jgi:hypothetical protein
LVFFPGILRSQTGRSIWPALARPTIFAFELCACSRKEEKSDEFSGTRTEPTTLPAAWVMISLVSLLFEPLYRAGARGLGHSAPHGHFGELKGVCQVWEISNLVEFHAC